MPNDKTDETKSNLHPLEASVLSLATGKVDEARPPEAAEQVLMMPQSEPEPMAVSEESAEQASLQKLGSITAKLNECMVFVGKQVLGRENIIRQAFMAIITGEHQLLISRTGMAKSLLARQIFSCFDGAQIFEKQLTKDTMPENLFGAYDIDAMKKGKMIHNVEGSLVLSHFAFLDEIFDANDMLLRSLLSLLNEKQLVNGEQIVSSTLLSAIAAANYIRLTEVLEAVIDRFMYKSYIPENKDLYFQYSIDHIYQQHFGKIAAPDIRITLGELSFLKKLIQSRQIDIPGYVLFLKNYIMKKYIEETRNMVSDRKNYTISDRKSVKTQDTLRAAAILDGRHTVEEKDLDNLFFAVCTLGREEETVRFNKILSAARNYFRQDKKMLENIFDAVSILTLIKSSRDQDSLKSDRTFTSIRTRLDQVTRRENSFLTEYFNKLKQTFMGLTRDTYIPETFTVLENISEASLKDVRTREARELLTGFRQDIFNEKKLLQL